LSTCVFHARIKRGYLASIASFRFATVKHDLMVRDVRRCFGHVYAAFTACDTRADTTSD
jgi:hypothetical protein